jgi:hypothetical protein
MPYVRIGKVRGFSPAITVYKNETEEYILAVQNEQSQFLTPNLCGFSPKISVKEQGDNTYVLEMETSEGVVETPNLSGFTPVITVYENTNSAYRLQVTTAAGSFITPNLRDVKCRIGDYYTQYPDMPAPLEADPPLPGIWEIWSHRAVMYGLSQSAPPSFVDYYSLAGTSITAGSTPVVCYHKTGGDFRLYRFIAQTAAYTVPAELDPVMWTYLNPGIINERQKCGNSLTADDYGIGDVVASGQYDGMYVTEVIVPGGKFWSVEGEFRPPFISGGAAPDMMREITGNFQTQDSDTPYPPTGVFTLGEKLEGGGANGTYMGARRFNFNAAKRVTTGPQNSPVTASIRIWRRLPDVPG